MAVDRARRPLGAASTGAGTTSSEDAFTAVSIGRAPVATIVRPAQRAFFHAMPNIQQQKKRVGIATRQREENIRFRSTVKTLTKRLEAAVAAGDAATIADEHRTLVRWVDRAASKGALHANTAARKKSQAARRGA